MKLVVLFLTFALVAAAPHKGLYHYNPSLQEEVVSRSIVSGGFFPITVYTKSVLSGVAPRLILKDGGEGIFLAEAVQTDLKQIGDYAGKLVFNVPDVFAKNSNLTASNLLVTTRSGDPTSAECKPDETCASGIGCIDPDRSIVTTLIEDPNNFRHMTLDITATQYMGACLTLYRRDHQTAAVTTQLTTHNDYDRHVEMSENLKDFYFEYLYPACDYVTNVNKYVCNAIDLAANSQAMDYTTPADVQGFWLSFKEGTHNVIAHIHDRENGNCGPVVYDYTYSRHDGTCTGATILNSAGSGQAEQDWPPPNYFFTTHVETREELRQNQALHVCVTARYKEKTSRTVCDCIRWEPDATIVDFPCTQPTVDTCDDETFTVSWNSLAGCAYETDNLDYKVTVSVLDQERWVQVVPVDTLSLTFPHAGPGLEHKVCIASYINCKESCCGDACLTPTTTTAAPTTTTAAPVTDSPIIPDFCPHCDRAYNVCPQNCGEDCCTTFTTPPLCVEHEGCEQTLPIASSRPYLQCGIHNPNMAEVTINLVCGSDRPRVATYEDYKWSVEVGEMQWAAVKQCQWEVTAANCGCGGYNDACTKVCEPFQYPMCPDCPSEPRVTISQTSSGRNIDIAINDPVNQCGGKYDNDLVYSVTWKWSNSFMVGTTDMCADRTELVKASVIANQCGGTAHFYYDNNCYGTYSYTVKASTRKDFIANSPNRCWARQWWDCTTEGAITSVARCQRVTQHDD